MLLAKIYYTYVYSSSKHTSFTLIELKIYKASKYNNYYQQYIVRTQYFNIILLYKIHNT